MSKRFYYPDAGEEDEEDEEEAMARIFIYNGTIWSGKDALTMQTALREAGYTDYEDKPLNPNGKWGRRSQSAFEKMLAVHNVTHDNTQEGAHKVILTIDNKEVFKWQS